MVVYVLTLRDFNIFILQLIAFRYVIYFTLIHSDMLQEELLQLTSIC